MKIVVRAGGIGTRLWPVSRDVQPKQFHALIGRSTMFQDAVNRIRSVVKPENLFVSTGERFTHLVREQMPDIRPENIIIEPATRDTGPAVGLEAIYVAHQDPDAIIASLGSDHLIQKPGEFCRLLRVAEGMVKKNPEYLLTMGIRPSYPNTGYGYIKMGKQIAEIRREEVYEVSRFTEKPDLRRARRYVNSGQYLWNSNMFVWHVQTILSLYEKFKPDMFKALMKISRAIGTPRESSVLKREYSRLEKISVDYAIIERADKVAVVPADIGWSDIGSWETLGEVLQADPSGNIVSGSAVCIDSRNSVIRALGDRLVAVIGVEDLAIIDTPDALLVCPKDRSQDVKKVIEHLKNKKLKRYL